MEHTLNRESHFDSPRLEGYRQDHVDKEIDRLIFDLQDICATRYRYSALSRISETIGLVDSRLKFLRAQRYRWLAGE